MLAASLAQDTSPVKQQIVDFMTDFTVETTPGSAAKIPDYRAMLKPGTRVAVTFLPGSDFKETVAVTKRLRNEGLEPAPHFAARSFASKAAFADGLKALVEEAGVRHAVALAGAVERPLGPFSSSMDLLETGLFDANGIQSIGVAGHPEGSPDIPPPELAEALAWKQAFAAKSDAELYIVTQFAFEAAPVIAWEQSLRAAGITLPVRIGIPGLATLKTLIAHAKACGVGPSMRVLTRQAKNLAKLVTVSAPDKLVRDLAVYNAQHPESLIAGVHMYPLGGLRRSAAWSYAVVEGDFAILPKDKGFALTREID